jgi:hypothetical protein
MAERRTFGPVVLAGLAGAGLAAVAGNEAWAGATGCEVPVAGTADSPGTTAVALALLAAWGVLLVTRGRVRRGVSFLVAVLAVGLAPTVVLGLQTARDSFDEDPTAGCGSVSTTGWFWVAAVAAVLALVAGVAAAVLTPRWPEMGRRYDAPADQPVAPAKPPEERENLDLWKDMDQGRDPTA